MTDNQPWYRWDEESLVLTLRVQPRARRDELVGPHGDAFRVRVKAPPVDGRANTHLAAFLAQAFGVKPSSVTVEAGQTGRRKRVRIRSPRRLPIPEIRPRP